MYNLERLCNKLNTAGINVGRDRHGRHPEVWSPDNDLIQSLTSLPEENFDKILEMDYSEYKTFEDVYQAWGRNGYLRMMPYRRTDMKCPTLTIRHDRHLHIFRGYYYQVSHTPNGLISHDTGCYRIGFLTNRSVLTRELWSQSVLANMLCYAAMMDAACSYDNFRDWFDEHPDEVSQFVKDSMSYVGSEVTMNWDDLKGYFSNETDWTSSDRTIYKVVGPKGIICEFAFGETTVQVRAAVNEDEPVVLTVKVPDPLDGVKDVDEWDTADLDEFERSITQVQAVSEGRRERCDIKMILIMAMSLAGMKINWISCYPMGKAKVIRGTNKPGVRKINSLDDIMNFEPDPY